MVELLSEERITESLEHLPEWKREGESISRTVEFPSFTQAIQAVNRIAEIAESEDHHPDVDIRHTVVRFACTTHFLGGLTENDFSLAREINGVVEQLLG
ncbi:4a-hydroxytetrahydrobiopterin dehydratase [Salinifilum aidingensis]